MSISQFVKYLETFFYSRPTEVSYFAVGNLKVKRYNNEFWTSKQRQSNNIHEIAYRACFKPDLPNFFIKNLTCSGGVVYDPFSGRGTTIIEAALLGREIVSNDINPISKILALPRLSPPGILELEERLASIQIQDNLKREIDLSPFYHPKTEKEILSLRQYLQTKKVLGTEDDLDRWIRMVATNRLSGHSSGYFSVYTLPPNQAVSLERQRKINLKRNQEPEYRDIKRLIIKKTKSLIRDIDDNLAENLLKAKMNALFLEEDSRKTKEIKSSSVDLVVTSPPFLAVVQYSDDNWLRSWFNSIDIKDLSNKITITNNIFEWRDMMKDTLRELYRIIKPGGVVAFEVGEVNNGKTNLDEEIVPLGLDVGLNCMGIMINEQNFTKTSNIWGIDNNRKGTNSNRIVLLTK